ncbi:hypothetical protein VTJ04DRAFT_5118 [Mycothermus thermophilus]|uniref:uncharacterized protein n=1 Tax=Humicola insolens TaxID=85995 RepID=UPI0037437944
MSRNQDPRYDPDPPIPTYEEAIAAGSAYHREYDLRNDASQGENEGQSLLTSRSHHDPSSSSSQNPPRGRRPRGYRPPTVETDDESSLLSSSDSDDSDTEREAAQVRREMQEMEIDDSEVHRRARSSWGKRIGRFSLPQWRWKWRWRLPSLRRSRGSGSGSGDGQTAGDNSGTTSGSGTGNATEAEAERRWVFWRPPSLPKLGSSELFLLIARTMALLMLLAFVYLLFASDIFSGVARRMGSRMFDPESVRMHVQGSVNPQRIRDHLKHFSSYAHVAGTAGDFALMEDTEMLFQKYGLEGVTRDVYHVYLNYPKAGGRVVELLGKDGKPTWSAKIEEEDTGGLSAGRQTFAFHAHSKTGEVKGPLVYANYGSKADFQALKDKGVDTHGAIALVRHHGSQPDLALKIKAAEEAGFIGCITYTDPADDGFVKGPAAPIGRFLPADGVRRGSVSLRNWVLGDPLTPGWESKESMPRMKLDQAKGLPKIPSLPLAWRDAKPLLQALKGFGTKVPEGWEGGVPDVSEWWTGNSSSPVVRLMNDQDEVEKQPIWNVYGYIVGIEQHKKKVIIGNHRDSLSSGAVDAHSGTAVMMEIVRILGDLVSRGWQPLRTIEFASWDGSEYNLVGSTEYVEQHEDILRDNAIAYINLDRIATGRSFRASGSPAFRTLLLQVLNRVSDPHYNATLRDLWLKRQGDIDAPGIDSDYAPFQDIVGTSSLDIRFEADTGDPYPAMSNHGNFDLVERILDPGFVYHTLTAQILGLLVLELADAPIVPLDLAPYADNLVRWGGQLETWAGKMGAPEPGLMLNNLRMATRQVAHAVREFRKFEATWESTVLSDGGWEPNMMGRQRMDYNSRLARFETNLLNSDGILPDRKQFKHVVFGPLPWPPSSHPNNDPPYFPAVRDAILAKNWTAARIAADQVATVLQAAADGLSK